MRKIWIIGLFTVLLFTTGCEVNYELDFTDDVLSEKISVNLSDIENTAENIDMMDYMGENEAFAISKRTVHEPYKYDRKGNTGVLSYNYTVDSFNENHLIDQCYDSFNFVKTDDGYTLVTSDIFRCGVFSYMPVDKYNIVITTNRLVLSNNADIIDGNKYIWNINSNGVVDIQKPIKISFSNETQRDLFTDKLSDNSGYVLIGVLGLLILASGIVFIIFIVKNKKNQS